MVRQRIKPRERSRRLRQFAAPAPLLEFSGSRARYRRQHRLGTKLAVAITLSWLAAGGGEPVSRRMRSGTSARRRSSWWRPAGISPDTQPGLAGPLKLLSGGEDKVVKVWDFQDGGRLTQTIRPMIWRGPRGAIYAMAVTAKPDAQGNRVWPLGDTGSRPRGVI